MTLASIPAPLELAPGCLWWQGYLDRPAQEALVADIREVLATAPLFTPRMPRTGKPFSVRMSNCGPLGWVSDESGYRYQPRHPETGTPWPPFPAALRRAWDELSDADLPPEACLINWYGPEARMGLHQDRDEQEFAAPVLSLSLGDTAIFRLGGTERRGGTRSIRLASGDALLLSGSSRLAFHGIDRILAGTSTLLSQPGRINLTLRRVHPAREEPDAAL
ncbi:alpha-ketoglutarate-dependent dioxygenase AlkB [Ancylobacter sonchi]|uniref:alpha-ketoglutarate-dependent dioxygenase AlkB family protein n=1 Tax=Ancylobacter sonchi TaxID=1937790 RepID=UPI001BD5E495|nr:alpha-ketoglutarate-dependent dioxygenase AlkB [Ancylobacter sonchi]MBS7533703.1 alpha-ketoglutarate-dependent dioxygenase AlkB [Ancylobacter sonchi]